MFATVWALEEQGNIELKRGPFGEHAAVQEVTTACCAAPAGG
jgi:hypothetical protein